MDRWQACVSLQGEATELRQSNRVTRGERTHKNDGDRDATWHDRMFSLGGGCQIVNKRDYNMCCDGPGASSMQVTESTMKWRLRRIRRA